MEERLKGGLQVTMQINHVGQPKDCRQVFFSCVNLKCRNVMKSLFPNQILVLASVGLACDNGLITELKMTEWKTV